MNEKCLVCETHTLTRTKPAQIIHIQIHRYNTITQDDDEDNDDGCTVVTISMGDTVGGCSKVKWDHSI